MRIAINTRLLLKNKLEGIGCFTMETMKRITLNHPEHEFIFIFDRAYSRDFIFSKNITPVVVIPPARHPVLFYLWFEYSIPYTLKKYKADLFISPDGYLSLKTKIPQLAVIHDISFRHRPEDLPWMKSWYYNYFFPRFAHKAARIATVSNYSKKDIAGSFGIDLSKIDVVYDGVNAGFKPTTPQEQDFIREKYTGGASYFLYVGALHPRKNIANLLRAFDVFKRRNPGQEKLLVVGGEMHKTSEIFDILEKLPFNKDILFTGRLSETELVKVYGAALALTYVPYFEGFGMPIIEAMSAGIPVICSNSTSMPEVGGDAVLYADPSSVDQIAGAMIKIATDPDLRADLTKRGFEQKKKFSWDETSRLLWKSIEQIMNPIEGK
jgi:glycosyltransferase involved in cell wall biosynthesis